MTVSHSCVKSLFQSFTEGKTHAYKFILHRQAQTYAFTHMYPGTTAHIETHILVHVHTYSQIHTCTYAYIGMYI